MNRSWSWCCGAATGAGLLFFLDPARGRGRRARLLDQARSAFRRVGDGSSMAWRDLKHRTQGVLHDSMAIGRDDQVSDETLVARVRAKLGRYVSNPGSIVVTATQGRVHLSGLIFEDELERLLRGIDSVGGAVSVDHDLETHAADEDIQGLSERRRKPGERWNVFEDRWAPATRAVMGVLGGSLVGFGLTRRAPLACGLGSLGLMLLTRATVNRPFQRLISNERSETVSMGQGNA